MARPRGQKWQSDVIKADGSRERKTHETKAAAEAYERSFEIGLDGKPIPQTLEAFVIEYFQTLWPDIKHPETVQYNINTVYEYFGKDRLLVNINASDIIQFHNWMRQNNTANSTMNKKSSALRKTLILACKLEVIQKAPDIPHYKEAEGRDFVLSTADEQRMFDMATHLYLMQAKWRIQFLLYTGCRMGELYNLRREDITDKAVLFRKTKNGKNRSVKLTAKAKEAIKHILEESDLPIPARSLARSTFEDHWNLIRQKLGYLDEEQFVPHMLRHTCCTRLVTEGVGLATVMKWMGHSSITQTMKYAHLAPEVLDQAVTALDKY